MAKLPSRYQRHNKDHCTVRRTANSTVFPNISVSLFEAEYFRFLSNGSQALSIERENFLLVSTLSLENSAAPSEVQYVGQSCHRVETVDDGSLGDRRVDHEPYNLRCRNCQAVKRASCSGWEGSSIFLICISCCFCALTCRRVTISILSGNSFLLKSKSQFGFRADLHSDGLLNRCHSVWR